MPKFEITSPDGKRFEVNAPDGATQEQVLSYAQEQFAKPAYKPSMGEVAVNAGNKAIAGVPDMLLNAPYNVINLGKMAYGAGATALGRPDLAPDIQPPPSPVRGAFESANLIRSQAEPQTAGQRLVDSGVQGAVSGAINPAASGQQLIASMLMGGASGLAGQGTKEATGSDAAAIAASLLAPAAISKGAGMLTRGQDSELAASRTRNAEADETLQRAQEAGFKVPPSMEKPTLLNRTIESIAGKAATQQATSSNNWDKADALARRAVGLPENAPITEAAMQGLRKDAYKQGYEPIKQAGAIGTGRLYRQALDDIEQSYSGASRSFPGAVPSDVQNLVAGLRRRQFDAGDALDMIQVLRNDASKAFSSGDSALGKANRAAAKAIEDQIERSLTNPDALSRYRDARQLMAKTHSVEDAIIPGSGSIDARKLAAQLERGDPLTGDLETVARFGRNYSKAVQPPTMVGSPGVSKLAAVSSLLFGGVGHAIGGPGMGATAAALPLVAPPMAEKLLLSDWLQKSLQRGYDPTLMMQMGKQPAVSAGGLTQAQLLAQQLRGQ